ncbi:MAG: tRNA (adenosine(37)-N6)-threonylcarbamoyltransferase complex ATPase subunit type 1 TsaE [Candidatus Muproteobacteria bacterium RBG_16_60_9]|jgi:tRNA threonylcarbamoyladenosine biosynthesis protein TsaE|uniref:tRNA threonylcarbamoyladenosine biosynthesis protein TsaE n=1 Tax=Candidatus Muproteobacteria bacterium RBG_16_60_9 TaxID=1817755 RepID=A0A1F6UX56_9PROT|nr:MAG: tRNA (adenosine(37)-N6)-threonylcarbamoyltransferase complex ATPase subunit type 1 TsaE [Candidatus Muproteobacteria bacterium RBG_16_60_9]
MASLQIETASEAQTESLGTRLATILPRVCLLYVRGPLGAGKTTLVRGLLRGLGHTGAVTSPTFTLVEPYEIDAARIFHFDFYRVVDPGELEFLGLRDYFDGDSMCIVEWPERAGAVLPPPDLDVMIQLTNDRGRVLQLQAHSDIGAAALTALG